MIFSDFGRPFVFNFGVVLPCENLMKKVVPAFPELLPGWGRFGRDGGPIERDFRELAKANSQSCDSKAQMCNSLHRCAVHMR